MPSTAFIVFVNTVSIGVPLIILLLVAWVGLDLVRSRRKRR